MSDFATYFVERAMDLVADRVAREEKDVREAFVSRWNEERAKEILLAAYDEAIEDSRDVVDTAGPEACRAVVATSIGAAAARLVREFLPREESR